MDRIIVSLTSFKERLPFIMPTISSLLKQTLKPDKIIITLFKDDVPYIPYWLKTKISKNEIELLITDVDIKSHTKYYNTMKIYKDDIIILVDDDLIYDEELIKRLYEAYKAKPNCICANRVHKPIEGKGYCEWEYECRTELEPSTKLFVTTGWGTLFPPNILDIDSLTLEEINSCLYADDVLIYSIQQKKGIPTLWVKTDKQLLRHNELCRLLTPQLSTINVVNGKNDYYLKEMGLL